MKQSALSNSDKRLLFLAGAVLILVAAYFLVFSTCNTKASEIESENETLQAQLTELQNMAARVTTVQAETEEMNAEREAIIATYPAGVTVESSIKRILGYEETTGVLFSDVSFNLGNAIEASSSDGEETGGVYGYYASLTLRYEAGYDQIKDLLNHVLSEEERTTISSISMSYNSDSSTISGTMVINLYYMVGTDTEYEAPVFDGISLGVDNLFGATNSTTATTADEEEATTADEE